MIQKADNRWLSDATHYTHATPNRKLQMLLDNIPARTDHVCGRKLTLSWKAKLKLKKSHNATEKHYTVSQYARSHRLHIQNLHAAQDWLDTECKVADFMGLVHSKQIAGQFVMQVCLLFNKSFSNEPKMEIFLSGRADYS